MMTAARVSSFIRAIYFAILGYTFITDPEHRLLFISIIFFGSYFVTWSLAFFLKDERWYSIDIAISALFGGALGLGLLGVTMSSDIIGIDKLFHFVAGGILAAGAYLFFEKRAAISRVKLALLMIGGVLAIGVLWECYEWAFQVFSHDLGLTLVDTYGDVVADTLGGALVTWFVLRFKREEPEEEIVPVEKKKNKK